MHSLAVLKLESRFRHFRVRTRAEHHGVGMGMARELGRQELWRQDDLDRDLQLSKSEHVNFKRTYQDHLKLSCCAEGGGWWQKQTHANPPTHTHTHTDPYP